MTKCIKLWFGNYIKTLLGSYEEQLLLDVKCVDTLQKNSHIYKMQNVRDNHTIPEKEWTHKDHLVK